MGSLMPVDVHACAQGAPAWRESTGLALWSNIVVGNAAQIWGAILSRALDLNSVRTMSVLGVDKMDEVERKFIDETARCLSSETKVHSSQQPYKTAKPAADRSRSSHVLQVVRVRGDARS